MSNPVGACERHDAAAPTVRSAIIASAALVGLSGLALFPFLEIGPLAARMAQHLFAMNVVAPLLAVALVRRSSPRLARDEVLWGSFALQLLLLCLWHLPGLQKAAGASPALHIVFLLSLLLAATLFWSSVVALAIRRSWQPLAALLLTGKIACLLAALLIFAPRDLYGLPAIVAFLCGTGPSTLEDQQLAGFLMVTACPLSYLVAGVILAAANLAAQETDAVGDWS